MNKMIENTARSLIDTSIANYLTAGEERQFSYERLLVTQKRQYLYAFIDGKPFPPFEVEIQMSSKCNLECSWCIGDEVQSNKKVLNLPNSIKKDNVDYIVDGIIDCSIGGLSIEAVKFSGFIGEPLLTKKVTLKAMRQLVGAGLRVGLFTNGMLMGRDTWNTILNIDYVHISLDAGPTTFYWLKESKKLHFSHDSFDQVLANIKGLNEARKNKDSCKLKINVGYVVVPGNHEEIFESSKLVKEAGADSIRFKCDIGGKHDLVRGKALDLAFEQIDRVQSELHEENVFSVSSIHTKSDVEGKKYASWQCADGCSYQHFLATIGSDGNLYLCDHNTMPGASPLGNVIDRPFKSVWESDRRKYLSEGVQYTCQCSVCPPFGNKVNFFLRELKELSDNYGADLVKEALDRIT